MKKIKTTPLAPQEFEVEQISENEANIMAYPFETGLCYLFSSSTSPFFIK